MDEPFIQIAATSFVAVLVALVAWLGDRRRMRRTRPDAVGFMPWTGLFVGHAGRMHPARPDRTGLAGAVKLRLEAGFQISLVKAELASLFQRVWAQP